MTPNEWVIGRDTGRSSKTIFAVMTGVITEPRRCDGITFDTPSDPDDFGRCYRLLELFPSWKARLPEVAVLLPKWKPLIREWSRLTKLYERDVASGVCKELYEAMKPLIEEGRKLDGWEQTSPGCWRRGKEQSVSLGGGVTISTP